MSMIAESEKHTYLFKSNVAFIPLFEEIAASTKKNMKGFCSQTILEPDKRNWQNQLNAKELTGAINGAHIDYSLAMPKFEFRNVRGVEFEFSTYIVDCVTPAKGSRGPSGVFRAIGDALRALSREGRIMALKSSIKGAVSEEERRRVYRY